MDPRARVTNRRPLLILGLALGLFLLLLATPVARAGDLDSLAGTGQQQPQGQWHDPELTSDERAAQSVQQQAAAALASVEPTNLNPLLGSLLLPQWRDDKRPDLQFGQGQLFLKNQDATRTLCNVTFTIRINFAQEHMMDGVNNMSVIGVYATDMHQDMLWLRGKFPHWMARLGPQKQLNIGYTISAPAISLPSPGQFFVERAAFCDADDTAEGEGAAGAKAAVGVTHGDSDDDGQQRRHRRRPLLRKAVAAVEGDAVRALENWASVDDNFIHNPADGRWYVQSQTRLNNTDAAKGRCNVQFTVALDGAGNKGDVRVEEGYLVNVTINARGELEGRLAPAFNRIPPGRYVNVAYVLSAPTQAALALSNFTVTAAEVC